MPSHLTRIVFRSILADRPLLYCARSTRPWRPRLSINHGVRLLPPPRRTFFGLFKAQRKIKEAQIPPGLLKLVEFHNNQRDGLRLPRPSEIAQALKAFFAPRSVPSENYHIRVARNAFEYLIEHPREDGQDWFSQQELDEIFSKLISSRLQHGGEPHLALGRLLHSEVRRLMERDAESAESAEKTEQFTPYQVLALPKFIQLLSLFGASLEARELAAETFKGPFGGSSTQAEEAVHQSWTAVLRGLAREENEAELLETVPIMQKLAVPFTSEMQGALVQYFAERKSLDRAKHWYLQPITSFDGAQQVEPSNETLGHLLKACALQGDHQFGQEVVKSLLKETPGKHAWDAIFLWSAAINKGPDEIDRMMNVMCRRNGEDRQKDPSVPIVQPDIDTINMLVEFAMLKQDPYSAERYIALGEKRLIYPNQKTFAMQIQYRLSVQDLDGAKAAYYGLQGSESLAEDSVAIINRLVQALCQAQQHHFDDTMVIVDDLHEHKAPLLPETVAALCVLHLRRGESHDAVDLLQVHAHHFSPEQRVVIRKSLAAFIVDGQTSTSDAWDAYQIMRNVFRETPREDRLPIMNNFFVRNRSDMACHVFFHMRNSIHENTTTTKEVYIAAFTGFARNEDAESLELAHNQLKLDLHVETDTQMRNALMLAYAAIGENKRALEFWAEIGASEEGPTYNSIAIAFRSCEGMPFGDEHAKSIWHRLKQMDVDIDRQIFTAYLGAIARNHLHDEALALVESAEEEYGFTPDLYMLGNWFNTTANKERQGKVEEWIKQRYPAVWTELEALGYWVTMDGFGYRQYNINRNLDP